MWQTFVAATDWLILMLWCGKLEKKHKWKWFFYPSTTYFTHSFSRGRNRFSDAPSRDRNGRISRYPAGSHIKTAKRYGTTTTSHQMLIFRIWVVCKAFSVSSVTPLATPSNSPFPHPPTKTENIRFISFPVFEIYDIDYTLITAHMVSYRNRVEYHHGLMFDILLLLDFIRLSYPYALWDVSLTVNATWWKFVLRWSCLASQ